MFQLVKNYIDNLTIEKVNEIALKNNINLSNQELNFLYSFIKKNYEALYANPNVDLSKYKKNFSEENYNKIINLINEYKIKYASFLA